MLYSDNNYNEVSVQALLSNLKNNLNRPHVNDKKISLVKNTSLIILTKKNWESNYKKEISTNLKTCLNKYSKSLAPDAKEYVIKEIDTITSSIEKGIHDGSLKASVGDIDNVMQKQIKLLVHQEIETHQRALGDHGIRHILSNSKNTHSMLDELEKSGIKVSGAERLAASIANINHDIGYTLGRAATTVIDTKKHKEYSADIFSKSSKQYEKILGTELTKKTHKWIATHDDPVFDWDKDPVGSSIRLADSVSLFAEDKLPDLFFRSGKATKILAKMKIANDAGIDIDHYQKQLSDTVDEMDVHDNHKKELKQAIKEITPYGINDVLSRYSGKLKGFKYNKDRMEVNLAYSPEYEHIHSLFEVGQKQFIKLVNDFTEEKGGLAVGYAEPAGDDPNTINFTSSDNKPTFTIHKIGYDVEPINATSNKGLKEVCKQTIRGDLNYIKNTLIVPPKLTQNRISSVNKRILSLNMDDHERTDLKGIVNDLANKLKKQTGKMTGLSFADFNEMSDRIVKFPLTKNEVNFLNTTAFIRGMYKQASEDINKAIRYTILNLKKHNVKFIQQQYRPVKLMVVGSEYQGITTFEIKDVFIYGDGEFKIRIVEKHRQLEKGTIIGQMVSNREIQAEYVWSGTKWVSFDVDRDRNLDRVINV